MDFSDTGLAADWSESITVNVDLEFPPVLTYSPRLQSSYARGSPDRIQRVLAFRGVHSSGAGEQRAVKDRFTRAALPPWDLGQPDAARRCHYCTVGRETVEGERHTRGK